MGSRTLIERVDLYTCDAPGCGAETRGRWLPDTWCQVSFQRNGAGLGPSILLCERHDPTNLQELLAVMCVPNTCHESEGL
jgi:hypothetical protein